ncbi:MAG: hypothetical protein IPI85_08600 [Dehalococcoidia bacterium]|jgi:hypothetical protein|uniref:hypothetical protein n=1 Tax=Candidatus Amarobacter glycogenicus TaxID=3140699 RepID=UPI00313644F5|nr:hypothetical protein [Dehalococcoidia bacterium]MBK7329123.1 hypothetical protein [Dehalococcoidia bacterium]MBK8560218.1 hypothetical protein [Dehalococcoidia bacterium]MBK9342046.1 hypothetical protein [Dehalococcoidia bacterium]MBK9544687.1 hypothetical protein [Dehalococcoidia bacterium]
MRFIGIVLLAAIVLGLAILGVNGILSYWDTDFIPGEAFPDAWTGPDSWSEWRDIVIVFTALFWLLAGIVFVAVAIALFFLISVTRKVMKENAVPAIDSLKASLDNVKGTTEFAGETVASPIIRVYSVFKGVRTGLGAVSSVGDRIKSRKRGK